MCVRISDAFKELQDLAGWDSYDRVRIEAHRRARRLGQGLAKLQKRHVNIDERMTSAARNHDYFQTIHAH